MTGTCGPGAEFHRAKEPGFSSHIDHVGRQSRRPRIACFQFVDEAKDRSIVFSYLISNRYQINYSAEPLRFKGLDPAKKYRITELNLYPDTRTPIRGSEQYSGEYLMKVGFNPMVSARRNSVVLEVKVVE